MAKYLIEKFNFPQNSLSPQPKILDRWDIPARLSLSNPINPCNPDTLANIILGNAHDCTGAPVLVLSFESILGLIGLRKLPNGFISYFRTNPSNPVNPSNSGIPDIPINPVDGILTLDFHLIPSTHSLTQVLPLTHTRFTLEPLLALRLPIPV
ncbi:hypothetical protein VAT7223_03911 [Vibrio atlanticus]|uniref:Uncharacterized protein n=1 Tax=Vibrio atlanticus TaxID=693153 RepID=A0A1C3J2D8_9VIBR|nr:hypothetical protein VAT7223_03911 [Vibrio atlanticus]